MRDLPRSTDPSSDDGGDGASDESETAGAGNGHTAAATPRRQGRAAHARTAARPETDVLRRTWRGNGVGTGERRDDDDGAESEASAASGVAEPATAAGDADSAADSADDGSGSGRFGFGRRRRGKHAQRKHPRSLRRTILEWIGVIGGGVLIALVIEALLVQAFWIPSPSMTPTLHVGDRVLVNKLSYRLHDVNRGDVIVFERPPGTSGGSEDEISDLIKRVVAVEGDTIEERNQLVYVNGDRVDESYLEPGTPTENLPRQTIPEDHVFVMGDNRTNSEDSRVFGPIDEDRIVGRAFMRVLPVGNIGWL